MWLNIRKRWESFEEVLKPLELLEISSMAAECLWKNQDTNLSMPMPMPTGPQGKHDLEGPPRVSTQTKQPRGMLAPTVRYN